MLLVKEEDIAAAMLLVLERGKLVMEGAGAMPVAAACSILSLHRARRPLSSAAATLMSTPFPGLSKRGSCGRDAA